MENLFYLVGWCKEMRVLETFHDRFWSRVRANRAPRPGYRGLTVQEYVDAYLTFQNQWKKASRTADHLDAAILACLPAENDELDGRIALAPRLAVQAAPPPEGEPRKRPLALEDAQDHQGGSRAPADAAGPPPPKARKSNRGDRQKRKVANLENALALAKAQAAQQGSAGPKAGPRSGGKAAGKGKGKAKGGAASQWCKHMAEAGTCPFGERCWFRHT